MFSTSTMASSTSSPIATAIPPRVITLIDSVAPVSMPVIRKTSVVSTSDNGMAVRVMKVVRMFIRKANSTRSTRTAPITRASPTLKMPRLIKFLSWKSSGSITMSAGSAASRSCNAAVMLSVRARVSICGCLAIVKTTPGRPLTAPSPRLNSGPSTTSATCSSRIVRFSVATSGTLRRSAKTLAGSGPRRPSTRIGRSCSPSTAKPPLVLMLLARRACSTIGSVTPYSSRAVGSTRI